MKQHVTSGIYRIVNTVTNTTYIGSSIRTEHRLKNHKYQLVKGIHNNNHLQNSWIKHGPTSFDFELLVECDERNLAQREQEFIDAYFLHDLPLYNQKPCAESRAAFPFSDDVRAKISAAQKGKPKPWLQGIPLSEERRAKIGAAHKGRVHSVGQREKQAASLRGRSLSPEHREKIGRAGMGRIVSPKTRAKIARSNTGKVSPTKGIAKSPETRAKISAALTGRKLSPEHCQKIGMMKKGKPSPTKGRKASPETRAKLSAAHTGVKLSAAHRAAQSLGKMGHHRGIGKKASLETRMKMSASHLLRSAIRKAKETP